MSAWISVNENRTDANEWKSHGYPLTEITWMSINGIMYMDINIARCIKYRLNAKIANLFISIHADISESSKFAVTHCSDSANLNNTPEVKRGHYRSQVDLPHLLSSPLRLRSRETASSLALLQQPRSGYSEAVWLNL